MVRKDTEVTKVTEKLSHRDTETLRNPDRCVFVSLWQILSASSCRSVSGMES